MKSEDFFSVFTNLGFPVALCIILLRYVLKTFVEKLDKLDESLNRLIWMLNQKKTLDKVAGKSSKKMEE